jgi:3-oxoacyl-[acyl-carrier protein] reductase|tara:strand:- start:365 stop:1111 length:747 start_codon:yes stop_codon:yes gene_type:complete
MFDLGGKVAVVTGASQGIGKVISTKLAEAGAHVICIARSEEKIKSLSEKINADGFSSSFVSCDISDGQSFSKVIKNIFEMNKKLDILVNNAGVTRDALLMRMSEEQWDLVLNTNLKGAFHGMKAAIRPMMKNKSGRIINITSIVGLTGNAGQANYAASKAGLIGMTKSIAKEVATRNITVNCIAPGWIDTEMTKDLPQGSKDELLKRIPQGRTGVPEDIAYTTLFLASDEANYITGQTITVDGGRVIN